MPNWRHRRVPSRGTRTAKPARRSPPTIKDPPPAPHRPASRRCHRQAARRAVLSRGLRHNDRRRRARCCSAGAALPFGFHVLVRPGSDRLRHLGRTTEPTLAAPPGAHPTGCTRWPARTRSTRQSTGRRCTTTDTTSDRRLLATLTSQRNRTSHPDRSAKSAPVAPPRADRANALHSPSNGPPVRNHRHAARPPTIRHRTAPTDVIGQAAPIAAPASVAPRRANAQRPAVNGPAVRGHRHAARLPATRLAESVRSQPSQRRWGRHLLRRRDASTANVPPPPAAPGRPGARLDVRVSRTGEISGAAASSCVSAPGLTECRQVECSHPYAPGLLAACATMTGTEIG